MVDIYKPDATLLPEFQKGAHRVGTAAPSSESGIDLPFLPPDSTPRRGLELLWDVGRWALISKLRGTYMLYSARQLALGCIRDDVVKSLLEIPRSIGISNAAPIESASFEVQELSKTAAYVVFKDVAHRRVLLRGPLDCFCEKDGHEWEHQKHDPPPDPLCDICAPPSIIWCLR